MTVAVFTDSTAFLPSLSDEISVVPLQVTMGEQCGIDGVDVYADKVTAALRAKQVVTTSRPTPEQFAAAYRGALRAGASNVVSVHISSVLSGTWESAVLASHDFDHGVVRVVDSRSTGAALGFAARAAYLAARDGGTPAQVQEAAVRTVDATRTYFYVDTLEYLRRGGRIGAAAALLATSLAVKPLLHIVDGQIMPLEKVRTSSRALTRLAQLTAESVGSAKVEVAVQHVGAPERASAVAAALQAQIPNLVQTYVAELSPVVAAHLGPGGIGTVVVRC